MQLFKNVIIQQRNIIHINCNETKIFKDNCVLISVNSKILI